VNPDAAYALIVTVIRRARNLTRAIGSLALLDVYGRVARLLLDNAGEENGKLVVGERMTHKKFRNASTRRERWSPEFSPIEMPTFPVIPVDRATSASGREQTSTWHVIDFLRIRRDYMLVTARSIARR
jgi:hypothetical protein